MVALSRTDTSILGRWWWTVDRWSLLFLAALAGFGLVLAFAASPPVAERLGYQPFHFIIRQALFFFPALAIMVLVSMLTPRQVRRLGVSVFLASLVLLLLTLYVGAEINGAQRWIAIGGFSLQVSEFAKPAFAVTAAWMLAAGRTEAGFPGSAICVALYLILAGLLLAQPDLGQTAIVTAVWLAVWFLAGLPMVGIAVLGCAGIAGLVVAYFVFPHVASRFDRFFNAEAGDTYQVDRAIEAFMNGGLFGTGPGAGTVKAHLPDAHADFVFAVVGEEFGLIACLLLIAVFLFIVLRGFVRALQDTDFFVMLAASGLLIQFALQALVNMASAVHLIPPKGMTLPFVSYGGSSMLAIAFGMGMMLALTRRRPGETI